MLLVPVSLNLLWLGTSTVKIINASDSAIGSVAYSACGVTHPLGRLEAGRSAFRFLEACGDDTLVIFVGDSEFCQIYVEGELYHVDGEIVAPDNVVCAYDHLFSSLLIAKALW